MIYDAKTKKLYGIGETLATALLECEQLHGSQTPTPNAKPWRCSRPAFLLLRANRQAEIGLYNGIVVTPSAYKELTGRTLEQSGMAAG